MTTHKAISDAVTQIRSRYNIELDSPESTKEFFDAIQSTMYEAFVSLGVDAKSAKGKAKAKDGETRKPNHYARLMTYFSAKGLPLSDGTALGDVLPGIYYQVTIPPTTEFKKTKTGEYPEWVRWIETEYPKHRELCDAFITTKRSKALSFAKFLGFEGMRATSFIWSICMPGSKEQKTGVKHTWANIIYPMINESGDGKTFVLSNKSGPVTFEPQSNSEIDAREAVYDNLFAQLIPVRLPAPDVTTSTDPSV